MNGTKNPLLMRLLQEDQEAVNNNTSSDEPQESSFQDELHDSTPNEHNDEHSSSSTDNEFAVEQELSRTILLILGDDYASTWRFWCQRLPLALLIGVLVGLSTLVFLGSMHAVMNAWFPIHVDVNVLQNTANWKLVWIALLGTGLSALVLLLPLQNVPRLGTTRTMFHDVLDLQGFPFPSVFLVVSCWCGLAAGAPLGPEMAVSAMGGAVSTLLVNTVLGTKQQQDENQNDTKTRLLMVLCGLAASLGGLFPSPVLGVLIVLELSVAGRGCGLGGISLNTIVNLQNAKDHDVMEQITLSGMAATMAYVTVRFVSARWSSMDVFHNVTIDVDVVDFELWHLGIAIPLGIACGLLSSLVLMVNGLCRSIRQATCLLLQQRKCPKWTGRLLFPVLAGLIFGLTAKSNPLLVGSGMQFVAPLLQQQAKNTHSIVPWQVLLQTALVKSITMSICTGFGIVGGPVFPLIYIGLCLGLALSNVVPMAVAVPCCMCGMAGSFVVIPFTLVFFVSVLFQLPPQQMGPLFVCTITSWTMVGGLGLIKKLGLKRLNMNSTSGGNHHDMEQSLLQRESSVLDQDGPPDNDDDVLRSIRTAIFGAQ